MSYRPSCLGFVAEGQQTVRFCGLHCQAPEDCPSGYDCGGVIYTCSSEGAACDSDPTRPGETFRCKGFLVENETGTQYFCAGNSGLPHEYVKT